MTEQKNWENENAEEFGGAENLRFGAEDGGITEPEPLGEDEKTEKTEEPNDYTENVADDRGFSKTSYEELARSDLETLARKFPETRQLKSITSLPNALRYAELRDLGLSAEEAYLATGRLRQPTDNRAHLHSQVPKRSSETASQMKASELNSARELFSSLSDEEIQKLYKRVVG